IDPLVPTAPLLSSLHALRDAFPHLPVSFSTEGLGGAGRRLRRGEAGLAFCILLPGVPEDLAAFPLARAALLPVVAPDHALGRLERPVTRAELRQHVQLVLSDPVAPDGPNYGIVGTRVWRFAELGRRLDFLLAGFGWCRMPEHAVAAPLAEGRLVRLEIVDDPASPGGPLVIHAAHLRDRPPGPAGRWLLDDLRRRLA
ncbi:MAG: substrate-binding domain-containing protein, partial [Gluconacetobacter diazotrophicus]|nr:substrate-binding domain-containing protein [Gluconacetobacter diazotrophicus]